MAGEVYSYFSKHVGVFNSNEAEVLAILEALQLFPSVDHDMLIVGRDSSNEIAWVSHKTSP